MPILLLQVCPQELGDMRPGRERRHRHPLPQPGGPGDPWGRTPEAGRYPKEDA